jgi:uncharacterized membrane protein
MKQEIDELRRQVFSVLERLDALDAKSDSESTRPTDGPVPSLDDTSPGFSTSKPAAVPDSSGVEFSLVDESKRAGNFLGMVAVLCFVLAASFLIKLAIDTGWLTPARQLALACLLGSAFIGAGFYLKNMDFPNLSLLPAAGVVILQLAAYSGHLHFELYGGWIGALFGGAVSALSVYLFISFRHQFFLLAAVVGSYMAPLIIAAMQDNSLDLMAYFLVWNICFGAVAISVGNRTMILLATYISIGVFAVISHSSGLRVPSGDQLPVVIFQFIQFLIFLAAVCIYAVKHTPLSHAEAWAFIPLTLFFYGVEYHDLVNINAQLAPAIGLSFAAIMVGAYYITRRVMNEEHLPSAGLAWSVAAFVTFHAFYLEILPPRFTPWFGLLVLAALPWANKKMQLRGLHVGLLIVGSLILVMNYGKLLFRIELGDIYGIEATALRTLYFAAFLGGYLSRKKTAALSLRDPVFGVVVAAHIMAMMALVDLSYLIQPQTAVSPIPGYVVSILWAGYAVGILLVSQWLSDRLLASSSLLIFALAAGKALLFDVSNVGPFGRIACLVSLGVALYVGGFLYRRILTWDSNATHSE